MVRAQQILDDPDRLASYTRSSFSAYDEDGSGFIDRSELKEALSDLSNDAGIPDIERALAEYDTDGSGQITLDEFGAIVRKFLESLP